MKILIAEDDTTSRLLLGATLQKLGYEVVATGNGREAWKALQQEHFPVVISDWQMPDVDGLMLCRELRRQPARQYTNFILLTTHGGRANYLEAMAAGVDDFLTKPLDEEQLSARLLVAARQLGLRQRVHALEGLLPICAYCKQIRDDQNQWRPVENFIAAHSGATLTHGICPACLKAHFPAGPDTGS